MVSIIIPSYNSEATIEDCLTALQKQTFNEPYEIILVDSSHDRTPQIVREKFGDVKFIHLEEKTDPGTARNIGIEKSRGELLLFIDSDCRAENDWMEKMVRHHRQNSYAAVGGAVLNGNDPDSEVAWAGYLAEFREFIPQHKAGQVRHIPACNISYKKEIFSNLSPYNHRYYPQEDLELNHRLTRNGRKIFFDPAIRVYHHHRTSFRSFLRHQQNIGRITAKMIHLLHLQGAWIVRNRLLAVFIVPLLPFVKWARTVFLFIRLNPKILLYHPLSVVLLAVGLIYWGIGFGQGVFTAKGISQNV